MVIKIITSTKDVEVAGYQIEGEDSYAIQFHPEVYHSTDGKTLLSNFLVDICGCSKDWTPVSFVEETVRELERKNGNDKVVLGLFRRCRFYSCRCAFKQSDW